MLPVDVFERSCKLVPGSDLPPHQQRVLAEKVTVSTVSPFESSNREDPYNPISKHTEV